MLINDKLYKIVDGDVVNFTTDDIPEGVINKYSAGGFEQVLLVAPWEPLPAGTMAYRVSDGARAYAVTTGSYPAYQVSDGDTAYHVTTGDYNSYTVTDGEKAYEISTGEYTSYNVTDGDAVYEVQATNLSVYEVTNGPVAYAVQTEPYTSYQVSNTDGVIRYVAEASDYTTLYNEKELITIDETEYETAFTYTGTNEEITLTGYADNNVIENATLYNNIELTNLMSFGYKQKADFSLVDGTKLNGVILYTRSAGTIGNDASGTLYTDTWLTDVYSGSDNFKYNGTIQAVTITCYISDAGDVGAFVTSDKTIYLDSGLEDVYTPGGIAVTQFSYTGNTERGHNYYTDQSGTGNLTTQKVYSDALLREEVQTDVTQFSWTGESVTGNLQTCYTNTNTGLESAEFYTTNKLAVEYVVQGAKTKADFTLTGNEFFGHTGYAEATSFTEIYTDKYLRDLASDFTVSDFSATGSFEAVSQEGWSKDESITAVYTTKYTDTLYEIKGAKQLTDFYRDGETAFGHTGYVATNVAIDNIYTNVLLTIPLTEGDLSDFEYTEVVETAAGQNAYVAVAGTVNEYLVSQTMYTDKYMTTVFNPTGAKTTQSFYYTGEAEMGHVGYVSESGEGYLTNQTIYTTSYLLEELNEGTKTDFQYTGDSVVSERALSYQAGDKYINTVTNIIGTWNGTGWDEVALNENMGYISNNLLYYYTNNTLQIVKPAPYKSCKTVTDSTIMLLDNVCIYDLTIQSDVTLQFSAEMLTQTGYYEFEVHINTNTVLGTPFVNQVTWINEVNINTPGHYLFKIRTFDMSTWIGEQEAYWA